MSWLAAIGIAYAVVQLAVLSWLAVEMVRHMRWRRRYLGRARADHHPEVPVLDEARAQRQASRR
jgi:hypothetical protein